MTLVSARLDITEATDDNGNSLLSPDSAFAAADMAAATKWPAMDLRLAYPAKNPGTKIARLRGTATMVLATAMQHVEIDNPAAAANQKLTVDGEIFEFNCQKIDDSCVVSLATDIRPSAHWLQLEDDAMEHLRLIFSTGADLKSWGASGGTGPGGGEIDLSFWSPVDSTGELADAAKMVWDVPTKTRTVQFPVEFTDLDMRIAGR